MDWGGGRMETPVDALELTMTKPIEAPGIEAVPVLDHRKFVLLFDLYVAGKWVGSRRTAEQCEQQLSHFCGVPIEAYMPQGW